MSSENDAGTPLNIPSPDERLNRSLADTRKAGPADLSILAGPSETFTKFAGTGAPPPPLPAPDEGCSRFIKPKAASGATADDSSNAPVIPPPDESIPKARPAAGARPRGMDR